MVYPTEDTQANTDTDTDTGTNAKRNKTEKSLIYMVPIIMVAEGHHRNNEQVEDKTEEEEGRRHE